MEQQTEVPTSKPSNLEAHRLIHVICLPLQFKREGKPIAHIDDAVRGLVTDGSSWHQADGPFSGELSSEQRWQARVYFHHFVRRFLFDPQRSRWLQRGDITALRVTLPKTQAPIALQVLSCRLALFQPDIACLLLELECRESLPIDTLQRLLDRLRRVYPPYFDSFQPAPGPDQPTPDRVWYGGHCADRVELLDAEDQPIGFVGSYTPTDFKSSLADTSRIGSWEPGWAGHWKTLLAPLYTGQTPSDEHSISIRQFGDDRAAIMSYIAFNGPRALNKGQWVRLCFADDHGTDALPYARTFLAHFERRYCYDRYWYQPVETDDSPSRVLNCGYAFSYVGEANTWFFEHDPTGALFTFRHIYVTMGVIAHMQRAALLAASHRLTHLVRRDGGNVTLPNAETVRSFYKQFVEFTQTYWFDEVSPQEQGQQLFAQWQAQLRTQPLYDEVRQELRDLAEHSELQASRNDFDQSRQLNETVGRLGFFGLALTALSAVAGIFGMNKPEEMTWLLSGLTAFLFVVLALLGWRMRQIKELRSLIGSVLFGHDSSNSGSTKP